MHWRTVQRLLGVFVLLFSVTFLPSVGVSLYFADGELLHFVVSMAIVAGAGGLIWWPARRADPELRAREGFLIVALFWSVLGVIGSLPFLLGLHLTLTDAVFEAVSGFTTTGATVISGLDTLPPSILYHRQQLQWLGGMGVVVLAVAILPMLSVGGMQLYRAETSGIAKDEKLTPRLAHTARALWLIYLALTLACVIAYWAAGMELFDAVGHAYATVATGGFSTHDASIGHFRSASIEAIACFFMIAGGINFTVHFLVWRHGQPLAYLRDPEVRTYLVLALVASALIGLTLFLAQTYASMTEAMRYSVFQVVSVLTSTGFGTATFAEWPLHVPLVLACLSFVGGCAGSTAGGMKVVRIMLLYKNAQRETMTLIHPRAVVPVRLGARIVPDEVVQSVWGFYTLYVLTAIVLTGLMMALGLDLESAFGAVIASINLLGPGLGEVATSFATVGDAVKWLAVFGMLVGRLEVFTLLVLFSGAFWRDLA